MSLLLSLLAAAAPLPNQIPPRRTAAEITKPALKFDCALAPSGEATRVLRFVVTGGRGYQPIGPDSRGQPQEAQLTDQQVEISEDPSRYFVGHRLNHISFTEWSGQFYVAQASPLGLAVWREGQDSSTMRAVVRGALPNDITATGSCTVAVIPQLPLTDQDNAEPQP